MSGTTAVFQIRSCVKMVDSFFVIPSHPGAEAESMGETMVALLRVLVVVNLLGLLGVFIIGLFE